MKNKKKLNIGIVMDPLSTISAEVRAVYEAFGSATIITAYGSNDLSQNSDFNPVIKYSFLDKLPAFLRTAGLVRRAIKGISLKEYDAVINMSSFKEFNTDNTVFHLFPEDISDISSKDLIISKSFYRKKKGLRKYNRESQVIYPPVEVKEIESKTDVNRKENWFLYLGRVETSKGVEIAIRAAYEAKVPLKIAGTGEDLERMKELVKKLNAKGYVKFLGFVSEEEKLELLSRAKALIFPVRKEDFGIVPVEANAAGTPVIAYREGGVLETISENNPRSGVFFDKYNYKSLAKVLKSFDSRLYKSENCIKQSQNFAVEIFKYKLRTYIEDVLQNK